MYPTLNLEVWCYVQKKWVQVANIEPSNRPHTYDDYIRPEFERLVRSAKAERSPNAQPIGYRITSDGHPVDVWMA